MLKTHIEKIPYFIFSFLLFTLLPISYHFFDNKAESIINILIIIFPVFTFFNAFIYSYRREDFSYFFTIFIGLCYLISCIIFWNFDLFVYVLLYAFLNLCGQGSGYSTKKIVTLIKYLLAKRKSSKEAKLTEK